MKAPHRAAIKWVFFFNIFAILVATRLQAAQIRFYFVNNGPCNIFVYYKYYYVLVNPYTCEVVSKEYVVPENGWRSEYVPAHSTRYWQTWTAPGNGWVGGCYDPQETTFVLGPTSVNPDAPSMSFPVSGASSTNVYAYYDCNGLNHVDTQPFSDDDDFPKAPGCGMPQWRVSEPFINLWLEDEPLGYQPAAGPRISLGLFYKQREPLERYNTNVFGFGNRWNSSWLSYVAPWGIGKTVYFPGGGSRTFFGANDYLTNTKLTGDSTNGFVVSYPDGSRDVYGMIVTNGSGVFLKAFMSERWNSMQQRTSLFYDPYIAGANPVIRLKHIVDGDGRTNFVYYATNNSFSTNLIAQVVDPFGRSATMDYNNFGYLTNLTDVASLSTAFQYNTNAMAKGITNMITPYGMTSFKIGNNYQAQAPVGRSVMITEPDGSHQLYLYTNGAPGIASSYAGVEVPATSPFANNFDNADLNLRNTFYWNRQQYAALTTTNVAFLAANDFQIARMRHWLLPNSTNVTAPSWMLSLQREPSPDGITEGQKTWFDYDGKTNAQYGGTQSLPLYVARVLPDGTTSFVRTLRNPIGLMTNEISTYSLAATVALRTNTFTYSANEVDLLSVTNALGMRSVSNVFNAYHQVVTNFDALNQMTVYTYDSEHRLTSVSRPSGLLTTNIYGADGFLAESRDVGSATNFFTWTNDLPLTHTDPRGLCTTNTWDALNRLRRVDFPDGTFVTNYYDKLDIARTLDRMGFTNSFGYDGLRRLVAATNANGVVTRYGYCGCGSLTFVTNAWSTPVQQVVQNIYDYQGNVVYEVYPGRIITNWFDALSRKTITGDGWGYRWFFYNNQGSLTTVSNDFGIEHRTEFDILDRPQFVTDANGVMITNTFDALNRLSTRGYPDGGVEKFGYSARGLIAYTNQLGFTNFYAYDEANRKIAETNANFEVIRYTNGPAGDLLALVDGKNQVTKWNYDEYGRVTNKLDQAGVEILRYTYDPNGRFIRRWSAAKGTTYYTNDAVGNRTFINYPSSLDITFSYDWLNRVTNMTDAAGTTKSAYTAGGQLWTEDGPFADDTLTNSYSNGLRVGLDVKQPTDLWWNSFGYDAARRLTSVESPAGTFNYTLGGPSAASRLAKKLALPNGSYITNAYDNVARLRFTKLFTSGNSLLDSADYGYNAINQRTTFTNAAGTHVANGYDNIGQLIAADGSINSEDRGYAYDTAWNLNYRTHNGTLDTFTVDGKNQLTGEPAGSCNYDANGNLTADAGKVLVYDDENQLTEWRESSSPVSGAKASTFTYDGFGRMRVRAEFQGDGSTWVLQNLVNYIYDGMRVIEERDGDNYPQVAYTRGTDLSGSMEGAGGISGLLARSHDFTLCTNWLTVQITNTTPYDLGIWIDDGSTLFVNGDSLPSHSYAEYGFSAQAAVQYTVTARDVNYYVDTSDSFPGTLDHHWTTVLQNGGGDVASSESGNALCGEDLTGQWLTHNYYHADGNGNVTALASSAQTLTASYRYDPFGNTLSQSGGSAEANVYRFSSKEFHAASGNYYYCYRFYSPELQRWLNQDPIGEAGGINLYNYVGNNPINGVDPLGLWNLFAPWTWGVPTGAGTTIGNSLNPLDSSAGWSGFSLQTTSEADAAFLDGLNPFGNPFANMGLYDPCDKALKVSRGIGTATFAAEGLLAGGAAAFTARGTSIFYSGGQGAARAVALELEAAGEGSTIYSTVGGRILAAGGESTPQWLWKAGSWFYANTTGSSAIVVLGEGGGTAATTLGSIEAPVLAARGVTIFTW